MLYLIYFFISGAAVSALIGAALGKVLKERPGAGAILALFFGPIGWLAVFLIEDELRPCSECKGRVAKDANICRHCRAALKPCPPPPKIGALPSALRFFGLLGLVITVITLAMNNEDPHATDSGMMIIGLVCGVIPSFLLFGLGFMLSLYRYRHPKPITVTVTPPFADPQQAICSDPILEAFESPPSKPQTIRLQCTCGSKLTAKQSLSGRTLNCPKCKRPVTVP